MRIQATKFTALLVVASIALPNSALALRLSQGEAKPGTYDQHSQELAVGNGVASSSDNHALRVEEVSETDGLAKLKEAILDVARKAGLTPSVITAPAPPAAPVGRRTAVPMSSASTAAAGLEEEAIDELQKTTLYDWHTEHHATMGPFGGFVMPISYGPITVEHTAVRKKTGLFDVSHMGIVEIKGSGATQFLNRVTTRRVNTLAEGGSQVSFIFDDEENLIDETMVFKLSDDNYRLVVNAGHSGRVIEWLEEVRTRSEFADEAIAIDDLREANNPEDSRLILALQGPETLAVLEKVMDDVDHDAIRDMDPLIHREVTVADVKVLISKTGWTGEKGFEFMIHPDEALKFWSALIELGIPPIGLGARDSLRLEASLRLSGDDFWGEPKITPAEAGYGDLGFIDWDSDFIGKAALRSREEASNRRVVNIVVTGMSEGKINLKKASPLPRFDEKEDRGHVVRVKNGSGEWIIVGEIRSSAVVSKIWDLGELGDSEKGVRIAAALIDDRKYTNPGREFQIELDRGRFIYAIVLPNFFYWNGWGKVADLTKMRSFLREVTAGIVGIEAVEAIRASLWEAFTQPAAAEGQVAAISMRAVRVLSVLDFLIAMATGKNLEVPAELEGEVEREYWAIPHLLIRTHADLMQSPSVQVIPSREGNSIVTFDIRTSDHRYLLSIQTQDADEGAAAASEVALPDLQGDHYRFLEVTRQINFPVDDPYSYRGSYLRGETDRFGDDSPGSERFAIKPDIRAEAAKGNFQFFLVEDAYPQPDPAQSQESFVRSVGETQHHFVFSEPLGVAADVVTGPARVRPGMELIVGDARGNTGLGMLDTAATEAHQLTDLKVVRRGDQGQLGVAFQVYSPETQHARFEAGNVVLGSMRHVREWQVNDVRRNQTLAAFSSAIEEVPPQIHEELREEGISLHEMSERVHQFVRGPDRNGDGRIHVYVLRYSLDGHLYRAEMIFPGEFDVQVSSAGAISVDSKGSRMTWEMLVTTDFPPMHLRTSDQLFTAEARSLASQSPAFADRLNEVRFLFSDEFVAAGAHRFLQFFSRDTLTWLYLFHEALVPQAHETALQSVLDRVLIEGTGAGRLPTEEQLGAQVEFELITEFSAASGRLREIDSSQVEEHEQAREQVKEAARALHHVAPHRLEYNAPDVDFMLLPAMADYLVRTDRHPRLREEFLRLRGRSGTTNLEALLANLNWVAHQAQVYVEARRAKAEPTVGLVRGFPREHDGKTVYIGNWNDTTYGMAGGVYPTSVNFEQVPLALHAAVEILEALSRVEGLNAQEREAIERVAGRYGGTAGLQQMEAVWEMVREGTAEGQGGMLAWSPGDVRGRLNRFFRGASIDRHERDWMLRQPLTAQGPVTVGDFLSGKTVPPILGTNVRQFPASLHEGGDESTVVTNDGIYGLLQDDLPPWRLLEILTPATLPYPVGLWTPAGVHAVSSACCNVPTLWKEINKEAYGSAIYGSQLALLKAGIIRHLLQWEEETGAGIDLQFLGVLYSILESLPEERGDELWTWTVRENGVFERIPFGDSEHNEESNPAQIWSSSYALGYLPRVREMAQRLGLPRFDNPQNVEDRGKLLDALAQARDNYPKPDLTAPSLPPALPRVLEVHYFTPLEKGGVSTVMMDHATALRTAGYPVTFLVGEQVGDGERVFEQRLGVPIHNIPELGRAAGTNKAVVESGSLDLTEFRRRVVSLKEKLRPEIEAVDVVIVHNMMTVPMNLEATVAFRELAVEYRGKKRFVAYTHNIDDSTQGQPWPLGLNTQWPEEMEVVVVSPSLRDLVVSSMEGANPTQIRVLNNTVSGERFLRLHPRVLSTYYENRLYEAEVLWFYPSRLIRTKLLEAAMWAAYEANRYQDMDVRLVIATPADANGNLPTEGMEGDYLAELIHLRDVEMTFPDGSNMADKVIFYADFDEPEISDPRYPQWSISDWYTLADALFMTSWTETYGIPLWEAVMAGTIVFHADIPALHRLPAGVRQVFPTIRWGDSVEHYGKRRGEEAVNFLRAPETSVYMQARKGQRVLLSTDSSEANFDVLSPWLNVPASGRRGIQPAFRNFPEDVTVETALGRAADAGLGRVEINFQGFRPSDVGSSGRDAIRGTAQARDLSLAVRLTDFPQWGDETPAQLLAEAVDFAGTVGADTVTVRLPRLDEEMAQILRAAAEAGRSVTVQTPSPKRGGVRVAVENVLADGTLIPPEQLSRVFRNSPVAVSVWADSLLDQSPGYLDQLELPVATVYVGGTLWGEQSAANMVQAGHLLRRLRENRHWQGFVTVQTPMENDRMRQLRRGEVERLIDAAYMPSETVESLNTGKIIRPAGTRGLFVAHPPVVESSPETAGLEETSPSDEGNGRPVDPLIRNIVVPRVVTPGVHRPDQSTWMFSQLVQQLEQQLAGEDVLEVGTGPGTVAITLARGKANVVAVDVVPEAIQDLEANLAGEAVEVRDRIKFGESDLYQRVPQIAGKTKPRFKAVFFNNPIELVDPRDDYESMVSIRIDQAVRAGSQAQVVRRALAGLPALSDTGYFLAAKDPRESDQYVSWSLLERLLQELGMDNWTVEPTDFEYYDAGKKATFGVFRIRIAAGLEEVVGAFRDSVDEIASEVRNRLPITGVMDLTATSIGAKLQGMAEEADLEPAGIYAVSTASRPAVAGVLAAPPRTTLKLHVPQQWQTQVLPNFPADSGYEFVDQAAKAQIVVVEADTPGWETLILEGKILLEVASNKDAESITPGLLNRLAKQGLFEPGLGTLIVIQSLRYHDIEDVILIFA